MLGWGPVLFGASGPLPHTNYVKADPWGTPLWLWSHTTAMQGSNVEGDGRAAGDGAVIQPNPGIMLYDDNHVGNVTSINSSSLCLTLERGGNLEVWSGELSGGRWAVGFLNRSPNSARIGATFNCRSIFKIDILTSNYSHLNFTKLSEAIRWLSYTYLHVLKRNRVYFQRIGRLQRWVLYPSCSTPPNEGEGGVKVLTEAQPSFYFQ